jgi:hypothetical protein
MPKQSCTQGEIPLQGEVDDGGTQMESPVTPRVGGG